MKSVKEEIKERKEIGKKRKRKRVTGDEEKGWKGRELEREWEERDKEEESGKV